MPQPQLDPLTPIYPHPQATERGMRTRTYIATQLMAGSMSNGESVSHNAKQAVIAADELIQQLNATPCQSSDESDDDNVPPTGFRG